MEEQKNFKEENLEDISKKEGKMVKKKNFDWEEIVKSLGIIFSVVFGMVGIVGFISTLEKFKDNLISSEPLLELGLFALIIGIGFVILKEILDE